MCELQCARAIGDGPAHCTVLEVFFFGTELLVVYLPKPYAYRPSFFSLPTQPARLWTRFGEDIFSWQLSVTL